MSDSSGRSEPVEWEHRPIIDWLVDEGRFLHDLDELVPQLGDRLLAAGAPIWRLRLSMRTLHPLVTALSSIWERDRETTERIESAHGLERRSGFVGSPLDIILRTQAPFRRRLKDELSDTDHLVLHELKERGGTDYFGLPMMFSDGPPGILVLTTDRADSFSDQEIGQFTEIASILAPITEVYRSRLVALAVAEAYLGPRTGQRVLEGRITRGDIEKINAAILLSDIRDWTGLNNRVSAETALALANRYFEVIGEAIETNGGEILKFIGDGVLAVFPIDDDAPDAAAVCENALAAARQALERARESDPPLDLNFGMGMHFGEVFYGNIGTASRIDFTVMGQAVNTAARIEGLCSRLDKPILFSQDFADWLTEPTKLVAEEILKGHDTKFNILSALKDLNLAC